MKKKKTAIEYKDIITKDTFSFGQDGEIDYLFLGHMRIKEGDIGLLVNTALSTKNKAINITVTSSGGYAYVYEALRSVMLHYTTTTVTAIDRADSAAALLILLADTRIGHHTSSVLFHSIRGGGHGLPKDIKKTYKNLSWFNKETYRDFVRCGFLTKKEYKKLMNGKDIILKPIECLERGIFTYVRELIKIGPYSRECLYDLKTYRIIKTIKVKKVNADELLVKYGIGDDRHKLYFKVKKLTLKTLEDELDGLDIPIKRKIMQKVWNKKLKMEK